MSQIYKAASSSAGVVFSVTGTNGVTASPTTGNVVVSGVDATTSTVGVASFNPADFTVTGGAVSLIGTGGAPIQTITGNTGGAEVPLSGNFNILGSGSITVAGSPNTETVQLTGLTNHAVLLGAGTATITNVGPTATSGQILQSKGSTTDPAFSTATYPSTTTVNQILYSSSANVVGGLATANNGVLIASAAGIPSFLAAGTTGQVLTATTGNPPTWASPAASSITITGDSGGALSGSGFTFTGGTTGLTFSGSGTTETLGGTLITGNGGTGKASFTAYSVIIAGTTAAGNLQNVVGVGTAGQILTSAGASALPVWSTAPSGVFAPNAVVTVFDDFLSQTSASIVGSLSWNSIGTLSTTNITPLSTNPGIIGFAAQAASSQQLIYLLPQHAVSSFVLGGGAITLNWVFNIATLSNGTNRYILRLGMGDTTSNADQVNGVYFEYSDNENSAEWVYKTASASTRTTLNSTTTVTTGWHNAQITINAAASSVAFSVDGVSLGTAISTNIPSAGITPFFAIYTTVGTTAVNTVLIDLFYMNQILTTAR